MTTVKLENGSRLRLKAEHEVKCEIHGITTTWGELDGLQRACVIDGLDVDETLECLLSPGRRAAIRERG